MQLIYSVYACRFIDYSDSASTADRFFHVCVTSTLPRCRDLRLILVWGTSLSALTGLIYASVRVRAGVFGALNMSACVWAQVFVCCQVLAVSSAWTSERAINTWGRRNTQTPSLDCIYGPDWGGCGRRAGSRHAQLGSGRGDGPTKTPGLLKPPWMSPRGQWSGRNAGLGLEVQGYVLLLMSSPRWASLALSPWRCPASHTSTATTSSSSRKDWTWTTEAYHTSCTPQSQQDVRLHMNKRMVKGSAVPSWNGLQTEHALMCVCVQAHMCVDIKRSPWDLTPDDAGDPRRYEHFPKWCMSYMLY